MYIELDLVLSGFYREKSSFIGKNVSTSGINFESDVINCNLLK